MKFHAPRAQKGVSLFVVMVIMLLSALLVLGASRVANLSEYTAGNNADFQRAFEAAQMLINDAELDIQDTATNTRAELFSFSKKDNELILNLIDQAEAGGTPPCALGVCTNLGNQVSGDPASSFWNNSSLLSTFTSGNRGAFYGQYTGRSATDGTSNPIVAATNPRRAWYWIEILPYSGLAAPWAQDCAPSAGSPQYLYRITAVAVGRAGAPAVIQEIFTPKPEGENRRCPA